mmetsp:Transcript_99471/g.172674  ORF Transcript_99471/g.172674 Transcript_99471/m.172674 type:complete len:427 (-) Transcript_99471:59-1339(-)
MASTLRPLIRWFGAFRSNGRCARMSTFALPGPVPSNGFWLLQTWTHNAAQTWTRKATRASAMESLAKRAQVDTAFFSGLGLAGVFGVIAYGFPAELKHRMIDAYLGTVQGLLQLLEVDRQIISQRQLLEDYLRPALITASNCISSCPLLYFAYHQMHRVSTSTSILRCLTGTVRVVPGVGLAYLIFACAHPVLTGVLLSRQEAVGDSSNEGYTDAKQLASMYTLGMVTFVETYVELQGIGVNPNHLTAKVFFCFLPTICGRLSCSVMVQLRKIGQDFQGILPESWAGESASAPQQWVNRVFKALSIDQQFFIGLLGCSFFQHASNGVAHVATSKGLGFTAQDAMQYFVGGLDGSMKSALIQVVRTIWMRFSFIAFWNWQSSNARELPCITTYHEWDAQRTRTNNCAATQTGLLFLQPWSLHVEALT